MSLVRISDFEFRISCPDVDPRRDRAMSKELVDLVQNLGAPRVLVVGDAMMDRYVWGDAERISQEAPVILLRADRREERLAGAAPRAPPPGAPRAAGIVPPPLANPTTRGR